MQMGYLNAKYSAIFADFGDNLSPAWFTPAVMFHLLFSKLLCYSQCLFSFEFPQLCRCEVEEWTSKHPANGSNV